MRALKRRRVLRSAAILIPSLLVVLGLTFTALLRGSLPVLEGEMKLPGLKNAVTVERDQNGVATIHGRDRLDVARATGFLHGQERFFQMDLMRRRAAGELSELIGAATVEVDAEVRVHRFRDVARRVAERFEPKEKALID